MAKINTEIIWKDRVHHMWFPLSFTKYYISNNRLYMDKGLLNTVSDETLLYRIIDLQLKRNFGQKIFGTGDVTLFTKADASGTIVLHNIKKPFQTKNMISNLVEEIRNQKNVVGKEFYGPGVGDNGPGPDIHGVDIDGDGIPDEFYGPGEGPDEG